MPSMTREEALTNLAMEVHPKYFASICFSRDEYLAERERLINKPSWDSHSYNLIAQSSAGTWYGYHGVDDHTPKRIQQGCFPLPAGHQYIGTLERRPDSKKPALSPECMNSSIDDRHPQEYKTSWGIDAAWDSEYPETITQEANNPVAKKSKYHHEIKPGVFVDVYDVIKAWDVTNPALQHLIKKALQPGKRGHKSAEQDMQDIIDSAFRAKELEE